ncbi:MAG: serine hydrolase [Bacteroidetes bacterium]|nr:serine hydrolase [Bacteroidota bacterium]
MTFVDEGKLNLQDTAGKYLPVLSRNGKGGIIINECLSHLTGIKTPSLKESRQEMKIITSMDEAIDDIARRVKGQMTYEQLSELLNRKETNDTTVAYMGVPTLIIHYLLSE